MTDQEPNYNEQSIPDVYTHIIKMMFNDEVHCYYVLPTEDVHEVEQRMGGAGPILEVLHVESMIREEMRRFLTGYHLGEEHINRLIQGAVSAHRKI